MANTGANIKPEAVREIAFSALNTSYQQLGPDTQGFLRYLAIDNGTDQDIYVSLDGVTDQFRCRAYSAKVYDLKTNDLYYERNSAIYIRSKALPMEGDAFVETAFS